MLIYPALCAVDNAHAAYATVEDIPNIIGVRGMQCGKALYAESWDYDRYNWQTPETEEMEIAEAASEAIAAEGLILLKNENGTLPLDVASQGKINIFGSASAIIYGGAGS